MTWSDRLGKAGHFLVWFILFLIPLAWSRYLNANYVSAKFFLVYFVTSLTLFLSMQKWVLPKWPKQFGWLIGLIFVLQLCSPWITLRWTDYYFVFKFLSLAFLAYYVFQLDFKFEEVIKKYSYPILFLCSLIAFFSLKSFYEVRIEKMDLQSGLMLGTFGNVNMMAEFLILSLPFLVKWRQIQCATPVILKTALMTIWIFMILYCRSRSAWIGLGLYSIFGLVTKQFTWKELIAFVLAVGGYFLAMNMPSLPAGDVAVKQTSFGDRLGLYISTLQLIRDNPFGVGLGQYMNEIVPYLMRSDVVPNEFVYYDQPHSEWLKWAVQFGWLGFLLPLVFLYFVIQQLWKIKNYFLMGSLVVLIPQISFQFPFENPASIIYIAICLGLFLKSFGVDRVIQVHLRQKILAGILAALGVLHALAFVSAIFFETSHMGNPTLVQYPCQVYPVSLNGCFIRLQYLLQKKQMVESRLALQEDLSKFYFHSGHLRLLPAFLSERGYQREACESLLMYNSIFTKQKFFPEQTVSGCRGLPDPVTFHNPAQFRRDFVEWQQKTMEKIQK